MIIFFGSFEIIVILLLIVACIAWGVETVGKLLPIIFAVALIKNLVQDIVFAIFKNRKNVFLSLLYLIIDFLYSEFLRDEICYGRSGLSGRYIWTVSLSAGGRITVYSRRALQCTAWNEGKC